MSRLWMETKSDLRKGTGKGASEHARVAVYWGSASDSKLAGEIVVRWDKGQEYPLVWVEVGQNSAYLPSDRVSFVKFLGDKS